MNRTLTICILVLCFGTVPQAAFAQQSREFNDYVVHYNALRTDLLPPQVAQGYGIQRSSSRALLSITVMKKGATGEEVAAVAAQIDVNARNLTGQHRDVELREIQDGDGAIYYVGELPVHNLETYQFNLEVVPEGETEPLLVNFRQQFYTE